MSKIFFGIILFLMLIFGIFSFFVGKFGSTGFNIFFSIICLMCLAIYGFNRLKEIDLKNMKLVLDDMKNTKNEIYAKAEEVKKIMVELAENSILSALERGRLAPESNNLHKEMIKKRDRAEKIFKEAGLDPQIIQNKLEEINNQIISDLIREIRLKSLDLLMEINSNNYNNIRKEFDDKFDLIKIESENYENVLLEIKNHLIYYEIPMKKLNSELNELEYFICNKTLNKQ